MALDLSFGCGVVVISGWSLLDIGPVGKCYKTFSYSWKNTYMFVILLWRIFILFNMYI